MTDFLTRTRNASEAAGAAPERPTGQIALPADWAGAYGLYAGARAASDADPENDAKVNAFCAAMDHLIGNVTAPDVAALNVKLELIRERYDPGKGEQEMALPLRVFEAIQADAERLAAQNLYGQKAGDRLRASVSAEQLRRASEVAGKLEETVTFAKGALHAIHSGGLLDNLPADEQHHADAHAGSVLLNELERQVIAAEDLAGGWLWLFLSNLADKVEAA